MIKLLWSHGIALLYRLPLGNFYYFLIKKTTSYQTAHYPIHFVNNIMKFLYSKIFLKMISLKFAAQY